MKLATDRRSVLGFGLAAIGAALPRTAMAAFPDNDAVAMNMFQFAAGYAGNQGFIGGFPNFNAANHNRCNYYGSVQVKRGAEWRDIPLSALGNPPLGDFKERMKASNVFATGNGFVGGFPTYHHADYGGGIVCGTVLLTPEAAEWRDVPLFELGSPGLDDIGARFRGTQVYAKITGFVGGFPNFFHADYGQGIVCGTILLKPGLSEWRDMKGDCHPG